MKVLLINATREQINMPVFPIGLSCVASAAAQTGHDVKLVDCTLAPATPDYIKQVTSEFAPDVIGIGIRNIDTQNISAPMFLIKDAADAVKACREVSGAPIVLGGAGYSIYPEAALEFCGADAGIAGEGEAAFPRLLAHIENGGKAADAPGVVRPGAHGAIKRQFERRLDLFPLPGYREWESIGGKENIWIPVQSRRGCPLACSYC